MIDKFKDRIDTEDARILRKLSAGKTSVFELGSFAGASAMAMLPQIKEAKGHLWCVDHFRDDIYGPANRVIRPCEVVSVLMDRLENYLEMVTIIAGDIDQLDYYPEGIADMVFIDASHNYSSVKRDIKIAQRLCRRGGTLCGHDYLRHHKDCDPHELEAWADVGNGFYNNICYGVIKAVHEFFGTPNHDASIWWVTKD